MLNTEKRTLFSLSYFVYPITVNLSLLKDMSEDGVRPNEKFYMALLRATGEGARADKTVEILQEMGESGVTPGVRSYNCAVGACGKVRVTLTHSSHAFFIDSLK